MKPIIGQEFTKHNRQNIKMIHFFPKLDKQIHALKFSLCITPNNGFYGNKHGSSFRFNCKYLRHKFIYASNNSSYNQNQCHWLLKCCFNNKCVALEWKEASTSISCLLSLLQQENDLIQETFSFTAPYTRSYSLSNVNTTQSRN